MSLVLWSSSNFGDFVIPNVIRLNEQDQPLRHRTGEFTSQLVLWSDKIFYGSLNAVDLRTNPCGLKMYLVDLQTNPSGWKMYLVDLRTNPSGLKMYLVHFRTNPSVLKTYLNYLKIYVDDIYGNLLWLT